MIAILKRELNAYFDSPLGYVFVAVYYLFAGYFFFRYNLYGGTADMRDLFSLLFTVTVFLIPILTMRLLSEERKSKTDQLLLMSPVTTTGIVLGKFFAAVLVYITALAITLVMAVVMSSYATPQWPIIIGHFIGLLLVGCGLIAICMLISALTESQVIAAVGGFCVGFFLIMLDALGSTTGNAFISGLLSDMSFETRYGRFTLGVFDISDLTFFLSITALFVYFTILAFEKRRLD